MSGAYVAKPDAVVTPDYPPDWNPYWPWPGPLPPDFDFDDIDTEPYPFEPSDEPNPDGIEIISYPRELTTYEDSRETFSSSVYNNVLYICLRGKPTSDVTVPVYTETGYEASTIQGGTPGVSLTFTATNYAHPQRVYLSGTNDAAINGDYEDIRVYIGPATSGDEDYSGTVGADTYVTNLEEVNQIVVYVKNIVATPNYHYDGQTLFEDYIEITATVYEVPIAVTGISGVLAQGTAVASGTLRKTQSGGSVYSGDAVQSGSDFYIDADGLVQTKKYAVVTKIEIGGTEGSSEASCSTEIFFKYQYEDSTVSEDDVTLEEWDAPSTHSADYGETSHLAWCLLDNTDATSSRLDKLPDNDVSYWSCEVTLTGVSVDGTASGAKGSDAESDWDALGTGGIKCSIAHTDKTAYIETSKASNSALYGPAVTVDAGSGFSATTSSLSLDSVGYDRIITIELYGTATADATALGPGATATADGSAGATCLIKLYQVVQGATTLKLTKTYTASNSATATATGTAWEEGGGAGSASDEDTLTQRLQFYVTAGTTPAEDVLDYLETQE